MQQRREGRLGRYRRLERLTRTPQLVGAYILVWIPSVAGVTAVRYAIEHGAATFLPTWRDAAAAYALAVAVLLGLWVATRRALLQIAAGRITLADIPVRALATLGQLTPSIHNADWAETRDSVRDRWDLTIRSAEIGVAPALGRRLWRQMNQAGVTRAKLRILQDPLWARYAKDTGALAAATGPATYEQLGTLLQVLSHHQCRLERQLEGSWARPNAEIVPAALDQLIALVASLSEGQLAVARQLAGVWTADPVDLLRTAAHL